MIMRMHVRPYKRDSFHARKAQRIAAELAIVQQRLDEALGIVRAIFDTEGEDSSLAKAITSFVEGEKRRDTRVPPS